MILANTEIRKIKDLIVPFNEDQLQPASYDLKLDQIKHHLLLPDDFLLASTFEWVNIPKNLIGILDGKSTLGREGIAVHITAGYIDPGFHGNIVLEIKNQSSRPVDLRKFKTIAQIRFEEVKGEPDKLYGECGNHYQNQSGMVYSYLAGRGK